MVLKHTPLFVLLWLVMINSIANAKVVEVQLANGITITADYQEAGPDKPTIILLHPFLQTRHFPTIRKLATNLANDGVGVLTPTLSLGISHRRQNLACEAIHTQTFEQNIQEINIWIDWLQQQNIKNIIGAGHGMGATMMLTVAASFEQTPPFSSLLLITLPYLSPDGGVRIKAHQLEKARKEKTKGFPDILDDYTLAFCNRFIAPRDVYLSMAQWDQERVLSQLAKLKIPAHVFLGSTDTSLTTHGWPEKILSTGAKLHYVEGANHFFADQYASSLFHSVISISEIFSTDKVSDAL